MTRLAAPLFALLIASPGWAQKEREPLLLEVTGRITDGEKKLEGCSVIVYEGNEVVGEQKTDKS